MDKELKRLAKSLNTNEQRQNLISYLAFQNKERLIEYKKISKLAKHKSVKRS